MFTRWKFQIGLTAIAVVLAALSGAFFDEGVAHTQGEERDYVDVGLILEIPDMDYFGGRYLNVIVVNHGSRTAYDVKVEVRIENPKDSIYFKVDQSSVSVGTVSLSEDGYSFFWTIPALGGRQRVETGHDGRTPLSYHLEVDTEGTNPSNIMFNEKLTPHEHFATVTTASFESDLHKSNNTARAWSHADNSSGRDFRQAWTSYSVNVSADDRHPSPGGTVNFTITASNPRYQNAIIDQKVDIELIDGLAVAGTPSYDPATKPDSVSYSNGVFNIGTLEFNSYRSAYSVTLPIKVSDNVVVNEQCLTATITGNPPPPGPNLDDISDNVAKLCLGEPPVEPLVSGQVDAFTVYPCVGITDAPCDSANDIRVRAVNASGALLGSSTALIQVVPIKARKYDAKTGHSVNDGNTVSWQTAVDPSRPYTAGLTSGVELYYSRAPFEGHTSDWSLTLGFSARNADGNTPPPGKVFLRSTFSGNEIRKAESPNYEELRTAPTGNATQSSRVNYFLEFEKLGTYKVTWHAVAQRLPNLHGSENCNPDGNGVNQIFSASETYTFHVGPIADLTVEDGGANSQVAADRNALTIVAANNGPDDVSNARVTGLPNGAEVLYISQGSYDSATGEWDIGELKVRGYYRSRGEPDRTLVLSASAGDTANVSIANSKNYEVCIGPKSNPVNLAHTTQSDCEAVTDASWNSTPVYDYNAANSTAKISATKGGGGGGPGAPGMRGAKANSRSVTIAWDEVEYLHGVPVRHHEVQKYMVDVEVWETVSGLLPVTQWTDFNVGSGAMPAYRVRAVNDAGVGGPWSAVFNRLTAQQQGQLAAPRLTAKWTAGDAIRLTWTEPSNQQDAITGYQLEYLAGDTWTLLASLAADETCADDTPRCYEDLGLPAGTERRYRVRAMAGQDPGQWSSEAVTATPPGAPILWAEANGPNAILITWDPGSDAVTGFELEASSIGADGPYSRLARPLGTTRSYSHNTGAINPEARHYRLRACNSAGCGDWSFPDYATTAPQGVPTAPGLTVRSSTASEIKLSWNKPHAGASDITGYELEHFTDGQNWTDLDLYPATATEYVHQAEFGGGTTHRYRVRAVNGVGNGAWSTVRSVSVAAGLPGQPELSFSNATDDSLTLSWTIPPTNGSRITGYRVERNDRIGGFDNWVRIGTTGSSVTTYTDRNLYSGEWLCYRVVATSNVGTGAYSEEECESTTGQYAIDPDPPVLRLTGVSPNRVTIAWDPPPDDGGRPVQSYLYQQADENGEFDGSCQYASWDRDQWSHACRMVSAGTRAATFSNLTAGESYQFRVRAETTYIYGDWATAYARLPRASDDTETDGVTEDLQVRLSATSLTVNEGRGESRYTVRLNKAPKEGESVPLDVDLSGALPDLFVDYEDERVCYGFEFNRENWNQGCVFTVSAREDRNADNEIAVVNHSIEVGGMEVTGPDVRIEVRDND